MKNEQSDFCVTILGSGTYVPSLQRSSCSALVQCHGGNVLLDMGVGTMHQLLRTGVEIYDIDLICLSHFHPDHVGELASFLFSTKYADFSKRNGRPLHLIGGEGIAELYNDLNRTFQNYLEFPTEMLEIHELLLKPYTAVEWNDFTIDYAPVVHNPESRAFRLSNAGGCSVVYSGDTDYSEDLVKLAFKADLLICESAHPDEMKVNKHSTPSIAGRMAAEAQVKKLVLTHLYPECESVDMAEQCRKAFDGPLLLARDLLKISL